MVFRRFSSIALTLAALAVPGLVAAAPSHPTAPDETTELTRVDADGYTLVVKDGSAKVGQEGHIVVTVKAKSGFKVNEKYPHKVKLDNAPDGLEYPKKILKKGDAELSKKSLTFRIPVKATKAGSFSVKGKIKISVCNEQSCLIKKEKLSAKLTAS